MIAPTKTRVAQNTSSSLNEEIHCQMERRVARCAAAGPAAIEARLAQLDQEWDIERCVETMAPTFTLIGLTLGLTTDRRWLALPFVIQAFFLQHALQGWCPPVPVLRRLGVRTIQEIDEERYALKALRGDFRRVDGNPSAAVQAAHA
jgi:hypothetical protein